MNPGSQSMVGSKRLRDLGDEDYDNGEMMVDQSQNSNPEDGGPGAIPHHSDKNEGKERI